MIFAVTTADAVQSVLALVAIGTALTAYFKARSEKDTADLDRIQARVEADNTDWREGTKNLMAAALEGATAARAEAHVAREEAVRCRGRCDELERDNGVLRARVARLEDENAGLHRELEELRGAL